LIGGRFGSTLGIMRPWEIIDRTPSPGGGELVLARRAEEWVIRLGSELLMSSRTHGSEEALASRALQRAAARRAVLVGGLGLGFTLRAALDALPPDARVEVVELVGKLVDWNRGPLAAFAGRPLEDPRVIVRVGDVFARIGETRDFWDAILLDVDNGPRAVNRPENARLYDQRGLAACRGALRPGGILAVWSAGPDPRFVKGLERAGLKAEVAIVPTQGAKGIRYTLFLGQRVAGPSRGRASGRKP
jgi:spermidine synthase